MKHIFVLPLRLSNLVTLLLLVHVLLHPCHTRETSSGEARQLLRPTDERNRTSLEVVEETLAFIETLQGPVAVVSIVGPYHTGKSFLLNQVVRSIAIAAGRSVGDDTVVAIGDEKEKLWQDESLAPSDAGQEVFQVGRNVDPETSGVWIYHKSLLLPPSPILPSSSPPATDGGHAPQHQCLHEQEQQVPRRVDVLFLDTEGFSVSNVTESYDAKVFAASTLLSSLLLYNSMHVLHANELEYLDLLVHNTQLFSIKTALKQQEEERKTGGKEGGRGTSPERAPFSLSRGGIEDGTAAMSLSDLLSLPPMLMTVRMGGKGEGGNGKGTGLAGLALFTLTFRVIPPSIPSPCPFYPIKPKPSALPLVSLLSLCPSPPAVGPSFHHEPRRGRRRLHLLAKPSALRPCS